MVDKIRIKDKNQLPVTWAAELPAFDDGKEYRFKKGVNVIVGENGCGKSTLLALLKLYLSVTHEQCGTIFGEYDKLIWRLYGGGLLSSTKKFLDGADVYADYRRNTFATEFFEERKTNIKDLGHLARTFDLKGLSKGQKTQGSLEQVIALMFSKSTSLTFDYEGVYENYKEYVDYVKKHRVDGDEWTLLMDEPDNSMDVENLNSVFSILSFHKEQQQVIAVLHNPLLIYRLSQMKHVNFIEMTDGYIDKVKQAVEFFTSGKNKRK